MIPYGNFMQLKTFKAVQRHIFSFLLLLYVRMLEFLAVLFLPQGGADYLIFKISQQFQTVFWLDSISYWQLQIAQLKLKSKID